MDFLEDGRNTIRLEDLKIKMHKVAREGTHFKEIWVGKTMMTPRKINTQPKKDGLKKKKKRFINEMKTTNLNKFYYIHCNQEVGRVNMSLI